MSVIIPVKSFSGAKSRLGLSSETKEQLCRIMLEEVLHTVTTSSAVDSTIIVSKDQAVFEIARKFNVIEIKDRHESGVNTAVGLADKYLSKSPDASLVLPQDIPFMKVQDIDFLLRFQTPAPCVLIVPSRRYDGTNALFRSPADLMETHYDEDSYKIHLDVGRTKTSNTSLVSVRRIMMDIDDDADLAYCLEQNQKPELCKKIRILLDR